MQNIETTLKLRLWTDVVSCQLQVFREPTQDSYQSEVIVEKDGIISPLQFPDLSIAVLEMLPPLRGS